jgi:fructose 5-dehydrogenase small subunit
MDRPKHQLRARNKSQFSRRSFVTGIATAVVVASFGGSFPVLAADDAVGSFMRASEFLTGRKLNPVLAGRYYTALKKRDPQFDADVSQLLGIIDRVKAPDVDAFLASATLNQQSSSTVTKIISSWYLGIVGEGSDAELISYAEALMYEPTRGILVVPSYGGGPNSWGEKPV